MHLHLLALYAAPLTNYIAFALSEAERKRSRLAATAAGQAAMTQRAGEGSGQWLYSQWNVAFNIPLHLICISYRIFYMISYGSPSQPELLEFGFSLSTTQIKDIQSLAFWRHCLATASEINKRVPNLVDTYYLGHYTHHIVDESHDHITTTIIPHNHDWTWISPTKHAYSPLQRSLSSTFCCPRFYQSLPSCARTPDGHPRLIHSALETPSLQLVLDYDGQDITRLNMCQAAEVPSKS